MLATLKAGRPNLGLLLLALALTVLCGCQEPGPRALLKGEHFLKQKKYDQALEQLQKAVRLLPNYAPAWNHLGLAYHGLEQPQQALKAYHNALLLDHKLAAARFNLGCLLLEQNQLDPAIEELTSYTMLQPGSLVGWLQLGKAQLRAGQFTAAERNFKIVLDLQPDHPEALNNLGVLCLRRRRPAEAMDYFTRTLTRHPDYAPAHYNAAVIAQEHFKNPALALKKYQHYLELKPKPTNYTQVASLVQRLEQSLYPKPAPPAASAKTQTQAPTGSRLALAETKPVSPRPKSRPVTPRPPPSQSAQTPPRIASVPPNKTQSPTNASTPSPDSPPPIIASAEQTNPPPRPASSELEKKASPPPSPDPIKLTKVEEKPPPPLRLTKIERPAEVDTTAPPSRTTSQPVAEARVRPSIPPRTATRSGRPGGAPLAGSRSAASIPRYQYVHPVAPQPGNRAEAEPLFREGLQWHRAGRQAYAIERYRAAVKLDPAYYGAYFNMAVAAFETADWQLALASYEIAMAIKPDSADALFNFSVALQKANYPVDALRELKRLLQINPKEARAHLALGNLYDQLFRDPKRARAHYQQVLALAPRHPEAQKIRFWLSSNP